MVHSYDQRAHVRKRPRRCSWSLGFTDELHSRPEITTGPLRGFGDGAGALSHRGRSALEFEVEQARERLDALAERCEENGVVVGRLEGACMRLVSGVMEAFAKEFSFPDYFGKNWGALDECLAEMDWKLPAAGILVIIYEAEEVLADDHPDSLGTLAKLLRKAGLEYAAPIDQGQPWDRPAIPFHVILQLGDDAETRWTRAGASFS